MKRTPLAILSFTFLGLAACGGDGGKSDPDARPGDDGGVEVDAQPAPMMITITGTATDRGMMPAGPVANATIAAYRNSDEVNALATTTTDAQGNFMLVVSTGGTAIEGFLKATKANYMETYLYPPAPIAADTTAPVNMLTPGIFSLLQATAQATQDPGNGFVALVVVNGTTAQSMPVAGATVSSTPAASATRYSNPANGLPGNAQFTMTHTDGLAYLFNLPGDGIATISAMRTGSTFKSHNVKAWKGQLTTTLITP